MNRGFLIFFLSIIFSTHSHAEEKKPEYPWLDSMHQSIASSVNSSALWFDDFFDLEEVETSEQAYGSARIRLGWEPRSRDLNEFETRFKVKVKLPKLKNRADLVLSDYDDDRPDNEIQASGNNDFVEQNRFSLALRWRSSRASGLSHRIGVGRRLQAFAKSRYRNSHVLNEKLILRWETSAYLYSKDGLGADFSWQLGYNDTEHSIFRWSNHFYFRDKSNDWLWQHSVQKLRQFDEKNALIAGFYIEGLSRPNYRIEEYLVSIRWRKNTLRKWLFYEVEPFVLWRRDEGFATSHGIALRVEGHFGDN
ncbi:hypothetical protein [uncultured Paraglaciecola sp.]|uniref:hypothetical protein n=1 Tax=uncultured Paraglaciecola sp. TaxID=1765024 RepID=UPI0026118BBE|nr:hypothetical protein [uncultured Paraglaciecola sp.]